MSLIFRLLIFSTIVTLIFQYYGLAYEHPVIDEQYIYYLSRERFHGAVIPSLVLVRHLGSKLLERHLVLWLDCVLSLIDVASVTYVLALLTSMWRFSIGGFEYQWISLCASTSLMLLLLLFNLARGLWILYSRKTDRWSMRVQHLDRSSSGSGPESFKEALRLLNQALFGQHFLRKRFKFEKTLTRIARGFSAVCLLVIFVVAAYDVLVIQPFSDQEWTPTAQYIGGDSLPSLPLTNKPWAVTLVGVLIQCLVLYAISFVDQRLTDNIEDYVTQVNITWTNSKGRVLNLICLGSIGFQCPSISEYDQSVTSGELFIGTNFTSSANGTDLEKDLHASAGPLIIQLGYGIDFMLGDPFLLFLNVHIRATLAVTHMKTLTSSKMAGLGFKKYKDWYIFNIDKITPDPDPSISEKILSSLRIFIPEDLVLLPGSKVMIQDVRQSTILTGTSILGGLWTFMTGIFSLIFGSSLLLVLFGIKPMSVYGFVHLLQGGRVSLAEGTLLTDEEQVQTVAILREHLMDVAGDHDAEGLAESDNGSNEAGVIESQESLTFQRQDIDLERGSEAVNPQG